jgi:hypothetical protein
MSFSEKILAKTFSFFALDFPENGKGGEKSSGLDLLLLFY